MDKKNKSGSHAASGKSGVSAVKVAILSVVIVAALAIIGVSAGIIAINRIDTVFPNVTLDGRDIGGLSDLELSSLLFEVGYEAVGDESVTVELPLNHTLTIRADEVCSDTSVQDIVDGVMNACHSGTRLEVAKRYLRCRNSGMVLSSGSGLTVDREAVRALVDSAVKEVNLGLMSSQLAVGEDSIRVVKGATAVTLDAEEITNLIVEALLAGNYETIVYDGEIQTDNELDLETLYDTIYTEPVDAEYDPESDTVIDEVYGMTFDMLTARNLWNRARYEEEVVIPIEILEPEVKAEELRALLFRDKLSEKTTSLAGSSASRVVNVTKAAEAIDGIILMPGEEFSYNPTLGERTAENGYQLAGAYSGGQTVQEYGGGICQVSSTLYYCTLYANLKITARTCHMFPVAYLPAGLDATVSWGGPEFKFINDREYPIKISAYVTDGKTVTVELYGTDVDGSYVEMTGETFIRYDQTYTDVAIGYGATTYRNVYDKNGTLLSHSLEARSTYNYHDEDIQWPEENPEPSEEPAPDPSEEPGAEPTAEPSEEPTVEPTYEPEPSAEPSPEPTPDPTVEPTEPVEDGETDSPGIDAEPWL